jgi:hypothetical protein
MRKRGSKALSVSRRCVLLPLVIAGYSGAMAMTKAIRDVGPLIDCRAAEIEICGGGKTS